MAILLAPPARSATARKPDRRARHIPYLELVDRHKFDDEDVIEFFRKLAPHMQGAVTADSIWIAKVPDDIFSEGTLAPRSRRQDLRVLRDTLVTWATTDPQWLTTPKPGVSA